MATSLLIYLAMAMLLYLFFQDKRSGENLSYKVEINEIMQGLEKEGEFLSPDLRGKNYIKEVEFLPAESENKQEIQTFYQNHNRVNMTVYPLFINGNLVGYVRFDYVTDAGNNSMLRLGEGVLLTSWLLVFAVLCYVRQRILKPFNALSEMPYELSKGHLQVELRESRNRFFGKFVWGIAMLRDTLAASKNKELKLEKEKKMLLLSISHDIKIPLSAIKLYARAIREGVYDLDGEKRRTGLREEGEGQKYHGESVEEIEEVDKEKRRTGLRENMDEQKHHVESREEIEEVGEEKRRTESREEQNRHAAAQIEKHAQEIEEFVRKIVSTASEDLFTIEVEASEFYLKAYVDKIREYYEPKCRLTLTEFAIGKYENKLLKGDIDRAFEVMENLMENAFKYGDGKEIRISFYEEDYCQIIEVFNSGAAVLEKEMPHLFDSFYRGSNAQGREGNGLGLYINKQIMLKMEGDIFAKRVEGGMCFCLVFNT